MTELEVIGAEPVPEQPRRGGRWRWSGGAVLLAAAIVVAVIGIGPGTTPHNPAPPTTGPLGWVEKMVDAPARGELAGDEAFAKGLVEGITGLVRGDGFYPQLQAADGLPHPEQEVHLLFAADIEDQRIAVLALRLPAVINQTVGRTRITSLVGPRGASPSQLVAGITSGAPGVAGSWPAAPFTIIPLGAGADLPPAWIGLAPPQCSIATATDPGATDFRDEPTGSYITRTLATARPEYLRITCDGTVREERPAPSLSSDPTDDELAALAHVAGLGDLPESSDIRYAFSMLKSSYGGEMVGPPSLAWSGQLAGRTELSDEQATRVLTVVVAPVLRGWAVAVASSGGGGFVGVQALTTDNNPVPLFAVDSTMVFSASQGPHVVAAFTAPGTASVRLLDAGGAVLAEAPVTDRLAIIPTLGGSGLRVQAVDAAGMPGATAPLTDVGISEGSVNWDGPAGP